MTTVAPATDAEAGLRAQPADLLRAPDLTVYTGAAVALHGAALKALAEAAGQEADPAHPVVTAVGSSNIRDLEGDTMEMSSLQDMTTAAPGMSVFLNHSYNVPEDLAGRLFTYPSISVTGGLADVLIAIAQVLRNPRAKAVYDYIAEDAVRMGVSIGALILDYEFDDDGRLHVLRLLPLEWSYCGIPANQRSWVEGAAKGLLRRSLLDGVYDERTMKLARAVKSLYPAERYQEVAALATEPAIYKDLMEQPARPRRDQRRVVWSPLERQYSLVGPGGGVAVAPAELTKLLGAPKGSAAIPLARSLPAALGIAPNAGTEDPDGPWGARVRQVLQEQQALHARAAKALAELEASIISTGTPAGEPETEPVTETPAEVIAETAETAETAEEVATPETVTKSADAPEAAEPEPETEAVIETENAPAAEAETETPAPEAEVTETPAVETPAEPEAEAAEEEALVTKAAADDKAAQDARAKKYGIGAKKGGAVTKPGQWKDLPDAKFGDPVNYRYPMPDKGHADDAASRFGDAGNRSDYTAKEQDIIAGRIMAEQRGYGEKPNWWPPKDGKSMQESLEEKAAEALAAGGVVSYERQADGSNRVVSIVREVDPATLPAAVDATIPSTPAHAEGYAYSIPLSQAFGLNILLNAAGDAFTSGEDGALVTFMSRSELGAFSATPGAQVNEVSVTYPAADTAAEGSPAEPVVTTKAAGALDSTAGAPLVRQDLDEHPEGAEAEVDPEKTAKGDSNAYPYPDAEGVQIRKDGTHEACKGSHSHAHKAYDTQGNDDMHTHAHAHEGDAHHGDHHASEKEKAAEDVVTTEEPAETETLTAEKKAVVGCCSAGGCDPDCSHCASGLCKDLGCSCTPEKGCACSTEKDAGKKDEKKEKDLETETPEAAPVAAPAPSAAANDPLAAARASLLTTYRQLGDQLRALGATAEELGVSPAAEPADLSTKDYNPSVDMMALCMEALAADDCVDAADGHVDRILCILGLPDWDNDGDGDGDGATAQPATTPVEDAGNPGAGDYPGMYALSPEALARRARLTRALSTEQRAELSAALTARAPRLVARGLVKLLTLAQKEGREFSRENLSALQTVHDVVAVMTDGMVCRAAPVTQHPSSGTVGKPENGDTMENAPAQLNGTNDPSLMAEGVEALAQATSAHAALAKGMGVLSGQLEEKVGAVLGALGGLKALQGEVAAAEKTLAATRAEAAALQATVTRLGDMPLGDPTRLNRRLVADPAAADLTEVLRADPIFARAYEAARAAASAGERLGGLSQKALNGADGSGVPAPVAEEQPAEEPEETLAGALAATRTVVVAGYGTYREWPAGVGAQVRPPLTDGHKALMHDWDVFQYGRGGQARVPVLAGDAGAEVAGASVALTRSAVLAAGDPTSASSPAPAPSSAPEAE